MLHVALWEPEIPPNTGNVARLCAATGTRLHLIGRLGFRLDDKSLKRAGLDYWPAVDVVRHATWDEFVQCLTSGPTSRTGKGESEGFGFSPLPLRERAVRLCEPGEGTSTQGKQTFPHPAPPSRGGPLPQGERDKNHAPLPLRERAVRLCEPGEGTSATQEGVPSPGPAEPGPPSPARGEGKDDSPSIWCVETPSELPYTRATFRDGDCLLFGSESKGLPPGVREACAGRVIGIPMPTGKVRSLNLATSVGIVLYEALRQLHDW